VTLWLAVALGGALGSVARYGVARALVASLGPSAWATLFVNVSGALLLGMLAGATELQPQSSPLLRTGLSVGVLGGYTTFSTYLYESARLLETGGTAWAVANLAGSVAFGLAAMFAGLALGRALA
jgi:CrcB protein